MKDRSQQYNRQIVKKYIDVVIEYMCSIFLLSRTVCLTVKIGQYLIYGFIKIHSLFCLRIIFAFLRRKQMIFEVNKTLPLLK